jgi:hypothetical protein
MLLAAAHLFGPFNLINFAFYCSPAILAPTSKRAPHIVTPKSVCAAVVTEPGLHVVLPAALEKLKILDSSGMNYAPELENNRGKCYIQDLVSGVILKI